MKQLTSRWVENFLNDNDISEEKLKQSFGLAATYRDLLKHYVERELEKLDKESQLKTLADKPNRAELLLAYQAKRETLNNFLEYIIDNS